MKTKLSKVYLTREECSCSEGGDDWNPEQTPDGFFVEYRISDGPPGDRGMSADFYTEGKLREYVASEEFASQFGHNVEIVDLIREGAT